jgi:hypothetical protein
MMLGMSLAAFTTVHVLLSLIGIVSGIAVLAAMLRGRHFAWLTGLFLATTILTSVTGFMFPFHRFLPSHAFGVVSLVALALSVAGLYAFSLAGPWRLIYVVTAALALYLNVFVGVVQAFQKLAFLQPFAPTQSEAPFVVAQVAVLVAFLALGIYAVKTFHQRLAARH